MSQLSNISARILLTAILLVPHLAWGTDFGLYGFHQHHPLTAEEKKLNFQYTPKTIPNYRDQMRHNLQMLINYAHAQNPDFQIILHEGQDILYKSRWEYAWENYNRIQQNETSDLIPDKAFLFGDEYSHKEPLLNTPEYKFLHSVNAVVLNNYYCGKNSEQPITYNHELGFISIEHCPSQKSLESAIVRSLLDKRIIYAFTDINNAFKDHNSQPLINDSALNIKQAKQARNITFMLDDNDYATKQSFVNSVAAAEHDIVVINPLFQQKTPFDPIDISLMQYKKNGTKRLLIAAMNVSEISPLDYFWQKEWNDKLPHWIVRKSFVRSDSYITRYWDNQWQKLISRYFKDITDSGYDGVFFTGINNHFYFEHLTPLE